MSAFNIKKKKVENKKRRWRGAQGPTENRLTVLQNQKKKKDTHLKKARKQKRRSSSTNPAQTNKQTNKTQYEKSPHNKRFEKTCLFAFFVKSWPVGAVGNGSDDESQPTRWEDE